MLVTQITVSCQTKVTQLMSCCGVCCGQVSFRVMLCSMGCCVHVFLLFFLCITLLCVLCVVLLLCCVVCCFGVCIMLCVCGRCTSDVCNAAAPSALITWPPIFLYFSHRPHQQSIFDIWYLITWPPIFLYFSHRSHLQSIFDIWYLIMSPPIFFYFSHRPHQQSIVNLSAKLDHVTFNFSNKVFTLNDMIWSLIIWSSVYLTIKSSDYQNIWSSTDPPCIKTFPKAQRTRGLSSAYQSYLLRSYHKFKHKSWSSFIFKINISNSNNLNKL